MEIHTASRAENAHRKSKERAHDIWDRELAEATDCNPDPQANLTHPNIALSEPSCPYDAGEMSRRSDRQTNALPPPGTPAPRSGLRSNRDNPSHRRRQANRSGNGAGSDSDSNADGKRPRYFGDKETTSIRKQKHPVKSSHEDAGPANQITIREDGEDELKHKYMQETMRCLADEIAKHVPKSKQITKENSLACLSQGESLRPTHEICYRIIKSNYKLQEGNLRAFVKYSQSYSSESASDGSESMDHNWENLGFYISDILASEPVEYEFVQIHRPFPRFIVEALSPSPDSLYYVFRVLLKGGIPMHAEPVAMRDLEAMGWRFRILTGEGLIPSHPWRYQFGRTESTRDFVYRVYMSGNVSICTAKDPPIDPQEFL